ncbi:MAG: TetR/AcrR family transcriptional regulator [Ruminiclostridium sp.]|nr:TetR/AcrR family transcriptional regulator [Ruminiclostridium sp.]
MARISKSDLTKLEIIRVATRMFLEKGYSKTTIKAISDELGMSTGNLTFYFPTKEYLLGALVEMLIDFQWEEMKKDAHEGISSVLALCFELTSMASACEAYETIKDFYLSAYKSEITLDMIRRNDAKRAREVFDQYCSDWTDEQYAEAEMLVSGIEYATLMTTESSASLEMRITGALDTILSIHNVPKELRNEKIKKCLSMDYRAAGKKVLDEFRNYVHDTSYKALEQLLKGI